MATATRALAALRQEGIVRPIPGVGTVVAGRHGGRTSRGPRAPRYPQGPGRGPPARYF